VSRQAGGPTNPTLGVPTFRYLREVGFPLQQHRLKQRIRAISFIALIPRYFIYCVNTEIAILLYFRRESQDTQSKNQSGRRTGQNPGRLPCFPSESAAATNCVDRELGDGTRECFHASANLQAKEDGYQNPHVLIRPFVRREAVFSSRIEGTQSTLGELLAAEAGAAVERSPEDLREVGNYVVALEYGIERLRTLPLSLRLVRELHEKLMTGVRGQHATPGEFRRTQDWIGAPGATLAQATYALLRLTRYTSTSPRGISSFTT